VELPTESEQRQAGLLFDLFKEQTDALVQNTKALKAFITQMVGAAPDEPGHEPEPGLMGTIEDLSDAVDSMGEALHELDARVIGLNVKLSGVEYVLDEMAKIAIGDTASTPPLTARAPTWADAVDAKRRYDDKVEQEMIAAVGSQALEAAPPERDDDEPAEPPPLPIAPARHDEPPPMLTNKPKFKLMAGGKAAHPPLPVAPPR